jgi:thioredoxin 1
MQDVTTATFDAEVIEASRSTPVLVDVWGPNCAPCLAMMPWMQRLADASGDALRIVKLNSAQDRKLCFGLRIMGVPTYLLYRGGEQQWRLSGSQCTPAAVLEKLGDLAPTSLARP